MDLRRSAPRADRRVWWVAVAVVVVVAVVAVAVAVAVASGLVFG
ncbi:hypothetical protein [Streptomyces sp. NRRL S-495]|nr:hypothetical protein [Streptomyces sp. NRRL S-495]